MQCLFGACSIVGYGCTDGTNMYSYRTVSAWFAVDFCVEGYIYGNVMCQEKSLLAGTLAQTHLW